ncbi:MAG: hypothetical protein D6719_14020 [Candidatus Dadabacteria bacterium]|nr:MAG: hypothetical protein D6719_14020 [Candidatus Dadabacteria bacterium]
MGDALKVLNSDDRQETLPQNLACVLKSGMCIACGACTLADPGLKLKLNEETLIYEPDGPGSQKSAACCPAIAVDFERLQNLRFPDGEISPHGVIDRVYLAQSTNYQRNLKASSGGLIKELMAYFLSSGEIDGIIGLKHKGSLLFKPDIIRSTDEIDKLPGSIYHNTPLDQALRIIKEQHGKFVLVGIPCQLEGIFQYIYLYEPSLINKIHFTIGLVCGWNYSHHSLKAICKFKGIDFDRIEQISYRGGGPVGKLVIKTPQKTVKVNRRVDFSYQVAFDRSFNIPRCHVCINHINFLADLVVGDAWLPSTVGTKTGVSIVICRNKQATDTICSLSERGSIKAVQTGTDDITESQSHNITFGDFAYSYMEYLREIGEHAPSMIGPNRKEARPVAKDKVAAFHKQYIYKRKLQQKGLYNRLWWRKCTVELPAFLMRYVRWFFVRVLKIKSLLGLRQEVPEDNLADFR